MINGRILKVFCCSLLCATVGAEPLQVSIQTLSKQKFQGTLIAYTNGVLDLQCSDNLPAFQIPEEQVAIIQFLLPAQETDGIKKMYDEGAYRQAAEQLNRLLTPFMPYAGFISNLTPQFLRWMIAAYWTGDYDCVLTLSDRLEGSGIAGLKNQALCYRGLVGLKTGDFQTVNAFLKTSDADHAYPPDSPERLYVEARLLQQEKKYIEAIRVAARLLALHRRDANWMPQADLLCAELYFQLEMSESAKSILDDIKKFNANPEIQKKAAAIAAQNNGEEK